MSKTEVELSDTWFLPAMFLIFLTLKLTHVIDWAWAWVFAPLWIPLAIVLVFLIIAALIAAAVGK